MISEDLHVNCVFYIQFCLFSDRHFKLLKLGWTLSCYIWRLTYPSPLMYSFRYYLILQEKHKLHTHKTHDVKKTLIHITDFFVHIAPQTVQCRCVSASNIFRCIILVLFLLTQRIEPTNVGFAAFKFLPSSTAQLIFPILSNFNKYSQEILAIDGFFSFYI